MKYDIPAKAASIADWQSGAISRLQLLDAGLSAQSIKRRLERGRWQQLHRGVYAVFTGPVELVVTAGVLTPLVGVPPEGVPPVGVEPPPPPVDPPPPSEPPPP